MKYQQIDDRASELAQHITVLKMEASHGVPAVILANQARIIERVAADVAQMLEAHPDAEVTIESRLNEGMETAYRDVFGPSTDIPDYPPEDLR